MGWERAKEPGAVKRMKRIAELIQRIRKELVEGELRRIERMAETARYFKGEESSDDAVE